MLYHQRFQSLFILLKSCKNSQVDGYIVKTSTRGSQVWLELKPLWLSLMERGLKDSACDALYVVFSCVTDEVENTTHLSHLFIHLSLPNFLNFIFFSLTIKIKLNFIFLMFLSSKSSTLIR